SSNYLGVFNGTLVKLFLVKPTSKEGRFKNAIDNAVREVINRPVSPISTTTTTTSSTNNKSTNNKSTNNKSTNDNTTATTTQFY
ncbi:16607_t:CDS:1, partial [Entrophospora sp. SA101]